MACGICYEPFNSPVSLPCGHIFCRECVCRTVDAIKSCSIQHFCPACRAPYSVVSVDPSLVPSYLRPHILAPIRPVYLDDATPAGSGTASASALTVLPTQSPSTAVLSESPVSALAQLPASSADTSPSSPTTRSPDEVQTSRPPHTTTTSALGCAIAEADALRLSLATWRRRAEVHAAANAGLLGFARTARAAALRMRAERDSARNRSEVLQKQVVELMAAEYRRMSEIGSSNAAFRSSPVKRGLPVFLAERELHSPSLFTPRGSGSDSDAGQEKSLFGPPLKRRRLPGHDSPVFQTASASL